ncbi:uracil-DNA glycosylase [Tubulinosema ratisbonensis]|uniref:Uracil-DNA glycosylase n=1 Tax=Tubulinosema ratisbonensis TaxID=291195 RepID=A0A437ANF8_9MICR|nr:uracil-DNA glycosylase [Tubulinosema ratisbonensis]
MTVNELICSSNCKICTLEKQMNPSWLSLLIKETKKDYFIKIKNYLHKNKFFPPPNSIFYFTYHFDLPQTKVVILGQDPYHNENQATGLAFSVPKNILIPPSLKNIFKEINLSTKLPIPQSGDLTKWSEQRVLLLNTSLTVKPNTPNSHHKLGWYTFTDKILELINEKCKNVVFMLWGNHAISKKRLINSNNHLILFTTHPSPFSANKGFLGCNHFNLANEYLIKNNIEPIDWNLN